MLLKKIMLIGSVVAATLALNSVAYASGSNAPRIQPLTGVDKLLTTFVSKSIISGALEKDANGMLTLDAKGNFKFNFSGNLFYPVTDPRNGELEATYGPKGSVSGQIAFPPAFATLAFEIYNWVQNGADPSQMPVIPTKIDFTENGITINAYGTTFKSLTTPGLTLEGRAFTGLGPVEIGQLLNGSNGLSMSVRLGGCFGVEAVSGRHKGKVGTYCLNNTLTFDLSGINLSNPLASSITGTGTSNCWTVLHKPLM